MTVCEEELLVDSFRCHPVTPDSVLHPWYSSRATVLYASPEIERTHKETWVIRRRSAECHLFNLGEILIYLAAAQGFLPRQVGNYHTNDGVNALQLITRRGRGEHRNKQNALVS